MARVVAAAAYSIALPVGLAMLLATSAQTALTLNALYSFAVFATNGAFWTACFISVPTMMRATTSAITLLVGGVCGIALGPVLVGAISDALANRPGGQSLQTSLVIVTMLLAARYLQRESLLAQSLRSPVRPARQLVEEVE